MSDHPTPTTDAPPWVCLPCGVEFGRKHPGVSTWHLDTCPVCGRKDVPVTEPRDFGGLNPGWDRDL